MRCCFFLVALVAGFAGPSVRGAAPARPNIFFLYADDWARIASCYADPKRPSLSDAIQTPSIDRIAREGVRFNNAFYSCPQCTPSRGAVTSGSYFWRTGSSAFLSGGEWAGQPDPFTALPKFPQLLAAAGYHIDKQHKTLPFVPTKGTGGGATHPVGTFLRYGLHVGAAQSGAERRQRHDEVVEQTRQTMRRVLAETGPDKPFFFVFGPTNTHRPYARGTGKTLWGIEPDSLRGKLPPFLPDVPEVREDLSDALGEIRALDLMLGVFLGELEQAGRLEQTLVVVTGDNGLPGVPRGKTQLYDLGSAAPLLARWPGEIRPGRTVDDFVTLMDLAPTFLEVGGVAPPAGMDGRSLMPQFVAAGSGTIEPARDAAIFGRERHFITARAGNLPYPARAICTKDFLYIRNFKPDRWPMGDPIGLEDGTPGDFAALHAGTAVTLRDLDGSLTKAWLVTHRNEPASKPLFDLGFGLRPAEELYDLRRDPDQMRNVAGDPAYVAPQRALAERLLGVLRSTHDPRLEDAFDRPPYVESKPESVRPRKAKADRKKK
ncbi:MAG TPA: sulfatase [Opitutaceae bacterium]|nr:sulfatase [Opitutaceae bacterium]